MAEDPRDLPDGRLESELERLLEELRVALPGVQILFAFLLAVPFANRFEQVNAFQRDVYVGTLVAAFAALAFMVAPTSYHRLRFRRHSDPERMVRTANLLAVIGLAFLAVALTMGLLLVTDFLFNPVGAGVVTGVGGLLLLALWYGIPLQRYLQDS